MALNALATANFPTFDRKKGVKNLIETAPELKKLPSEFVQSLERSPLSQNYVDLPVIDLSGLNSSSEARISTVKAISSACEEWGFYTALIEEMIQVAEELFDLSLTENVKYSSDDEMSPCRYGTSLNTSKKHNLRWRDYLRHYGPAYHHLWPRNPPRYRHVAKEYMEQMWQMCMKMTDAISEGLGLETSCIQESLGEGMQILAANYYPPCPEPDKTLGLAAHSDHCALTIFSVKLKSKNSSATCIISSISASLIP